MTDKEQIIIDGVDVSECKCLHNVKVITELAQPEDFEILCGATNGAIKCKKWKDCYFKQLARKTQEYEQKEKELKELKRQYKLSCLDCEYKNTKTDADRYRKALEEIKKVIIPLANKNPIDNCWALLNRCDECASKKDCKTQSPYFRAKQILDIINKAKGNN